MLKSCKVWRLPPIPPQLLRLERSNSALCANSRNFCNELLVSEWLSEQNRWYPQSHKANVKKFSIFASSLHFAKARTPPLSWLHMVMSPWYKGSLMITKAQNDALLLKFCALPEQKLQSYVQGAKGCKGHMPHIWSSVSWCFMMFHAVSCFVDYFVNSFISSFSFQQWEPLWTCCDSPVVRCLQSPQPRKQLGLVFRQVSRFEMIWDDSRWPWIRRMVRCMADSEVFSSTASAKRGFESGWIFKDLSWILTTNQNNNNKKKTKKKEEEGEDEDEEEEEEEEEFRVQVCPKMPPKNPRQVLSLYVPNQAAAFNVEPIEMLSTAWNEKELGWFRQKSSIQKNAKRQKRIFHVCNLIRRYWIWHDQEKRTKWRTSTSPRCSAYCNALTARLC